MTTPDVGIAENPADARRGRPRSGFTERFARVRWPLAAAGGAGLGAAALLLRDPHQTGSWGFCPLHAATGLYCPGCGALRGTADLLHGNLAGAWADNPLWVASIPVLVTVWVLWLVLRWRGRSAPVSPRMALRAWWVALGLFVLFGVVRNLPGFPLVPA